MTTLRSRWELNEIEISKSSEQAALRVVQRLARDKEDVAAQWATAIRLAYANGASLRDIADVARISPQTVANVCKR